ncbi:putative trehalose-phosphate phosphatase j, partial [Quercus suber]
MIEVAAFRRRKKKRKRNKNTKTTGELDAEAVEEIYMAERAEKVISVMVDPEIEKPYLFQPASEYLPMIDDVFKQLVERTKSTSGAKVENNKLCISIHFQCVDER